MGYAEGDNREIKYDNEVNLGAKATLSAALHDKDFMTHFAAATRTQKFDSSTNILPTCSFFDAAEAAGLAAIAKPLVPGDPEKLPEIIKKMHGVLSGTLPEKH